ncbi:uncharacterized protein PODANS_6_558, partial [Podospora anserina S mat+]
LFCEGHHLFEGLPNCQGLFALVVSLSRNWRGLQFLNGVVGANLINKFRGDSGSTPAYGSGFIDQIEELDTVLKTEPEELVRDILWTVNKEGMTATELCRDSGTCQKDPRMGSLVANAGVILVDQGLQMLEQSTTEDSDNIWGHVKTQFQFLENRLKVLEFENKAMRELLIDVSADMRIRQGMQTISTRSREMKEAQEREFEDEQAVKMEHYEARGRSPTPEKKTS